MSSKLRFFGLFSAFLLVLFVSCSSSKSNKCSEDKECQYGSYCSTDEGKCTAFEESDYKIAITTPEDGAHLCGEVTVEVALSEVSEKISDGKGVALAVEKDKDMQVMKETLSNQSASFKLDLSESGEYKLSAFLMQNPYVKAKITLYCDSDPEPVDDDTDTDTPDEDETEPVVDDDAEGDPIDEDEDTLDEDDDTPDEEADEVEPEAKPVAEITSHPQAVSSLATAEFTFESDIEEATFRCKIDANEWESCASPKVYENLVGGDHQFSLKAVNVGGTESDVVSFSWKIDFTIAVIQILAPWNSDKTGNGEADTCKANNYGAVVKDGVIYVGTTQDAIESEENFGVCFKVGFANTAAGAKFNVYRKNGEEWFPVWDGILTESGIENGFIMMSGLVLNKGENTIKVVVGGKSEDIADAEYIQKIVVATESPTISWSFPNKDYTFSQNNFSLSKLFATFKIRNSIPGLEVELFEGNSAVASLKTGNLGDESISFVNPEIEDSCSVERLFYAVLYDTLNDKTQYTNNTDNPNSITKRNIIFDVNAPSIDAISVIGKNGNIITSTVNAAQNPIIVTVNVSDTANVSGDGNRTVTLYTNNGSGTPNKILAGPKNAAGGTVVFEDINLSEAKHTLKVEVKDCRENISSSTFDPIAVSLTNPVLTVVSPKGKGDDSRWLVSSDVEHLDGAEVSGGTLNGVKMHIVSDKILSEITKISHVYGSVSVDITDYAELADDKQNIVINLPNLVSGRHQFVVSVLDFAGNIGKIGGGDEEYYEVDVVAPKINSLLFDAENYPVKMTLNVSNVAPETSFSLVATKGDIVKTWQGVITDDGDFKKDLNLSTGEWVANLTLTDDHGNVTTSAGNFEVTHDVPDITLKKDDGLTVLNVTNEAKPVWFGPDDFAGECATESSCPVKIRIYAPQGTTVSYGIDSTDKNVTIDYNGFETVVVPLHLIAVSKLVIASGLYKETYYLRATDKEPKTYISNPVNCPKSAEYCSIYDLSDDPLTEDIIELAEVGFGYDDDLTPGDGILNFKAKSAIKFTLQDSPTGGFVEIENAPEGFEYTKAQLVKSTAVPENYYTADFSNLIVPDTNANGQTDYDLVFVLKTESGFTQRYYVALHVDLDLPQPVSVNSSFSSSSALFGKINFSWNPAETMPYAYEVRYQSYDEGLCSIVDEFDNATLPLTEFAGSVPKPVDAQMSYNFFVNAVTNAAGTATADIHKNGNSYCAAVKAVSGVFANNGLLMAKNLGTVDAGSVKNFGSVKMNWTNLYEISSGYHSFNIKIIGDVNNDNVEDYAIADFLKSDSGVDDNMNGFIDIYSGDDHSLIKSIRGDINSDDSVGQGISSKADVNKDGFSDFVYTNYPGYVFVFLGDENGVDFEETPVSFRAKDASNQGSRGLATGDYDGDGCDDIIVSAPSKKAGDFNRAGEVYVYLGCKEGGFEGVEPDFTFTGNAANTRIGNSGIMAAGDLNNDGKTDFAIGSTDALYIIYGGSSDGAITPLFKSLNSPGFYMGKGDFNGDGITDLVYTTQKEIRIYYGSNVGINTTPDVRINDFSALYDNYGNIPVYNAIGIPNEAKDLNGDGADDLVVISSTGVLIYYTYTDSMTGKKQLKMQPSVFDVFPDPIGTQPKVIMLDDAIIYCNSLNATGNCERLDF